MNYAQIREFDISNGLGIRVSLFVSGCTHNCKGCFNREYHNFNFGNKYTDSENNLILKYLSNPSIKGLSLLGGEPMQNVKDFYPYLKKIREYINEYNKNPKLTDSQKKDIWIYSGYTFEEIIKDKNMLTFLELCDILVDGKFEIEKRNLMLKFRGSSNQRIIDIKQSLKNNEVIIFNI